MSSVQHHLAVSAVQHHLPVSSVCHHLTVSGVQHHLAVSGVQHFLAVPGLELHLAVSSVCIFGCNHSTESHECDWCAASPGSVQCVHLLAVSSVRYYLDVFSAWLLYPNYLTTVSLTI